MPKHDDAATSAQVLHLPSADSAAPQPIRFSPLPLVSGDAIDDAAGLHPIEWATVTLTAFDGAQRVVPLTFRHGGWWAPDID